MVLAWSLFSPSLVQVKTGSDMPLSWLSPGLVLAYPFEFYDESAAQTE